MNRQPAFFMILVLLLVGVSSVTLTAQTAEASGTIYIRADGSIDPPTAPISHEGNVYSLTGNISSACAMTVMLLVVMVYMKKRAGLFKTRARSINSIDLPTSVLIVFDRS